MIYQFYAKLRKLKIDKSEQQRYSSTVNYMEFNFDDALIFRIIGVDDGGIRYYNNKTHGKWEYLFNRKVQTSIYKRLEVWKIWKKDNYKIWCIKKIDAAYA